MYELQYFCPTRQQWQDYIPPAIVDDPHTAVALCDAEAIRSGRAIRVMDVDTGEIVHMNNPQTLQYPED